MKKELQAKSSEEPKSASSTSKPGAPATSSRRRFLKQTTATVGAAAVGASVAPLLGAPGSVARADSIGPLDPTQRARQATFRRTQAAYYQGAQRPAAHPTNGDEAAYSNPFAVFSKNLPHLNNGEVDPAAYAAYLLALRSGKPEDFEKIPASTGGKLVNPQAGLCFDLEGADIQSFETTPPPQFSSEAQMGELNELYWRALTRDIPFLQYETSALINEAIRDMRRRPEYSDVQNQTIFRSALPGDDVGYPISQFLLKPYMLGSTPMEQKYRVPLPGEDFLTNYIEWLNIQNGLPPARGIRFDNTLRYIRNGRDLGEYVHNDFSYQAFLIAALILNSFGLTALDDANPYKRAKRQIGFATFGGPAVLDMVGRIAALALKAAWFQKWYVHRRIRPEEFAVRVENAVFFQIPYPLGMSVSLLGGAQEAFYRNSTFLLPTAYPEGCPAHPSMPGGHATIAGACVTLLKAMFDETFQIPNPVVPTEDGLTLNEYQDGPLTIGGELNKLASNMAFGRDTAGVHWRSDEVEGLKLGEALAISVLTDFNGCVNENFDGFTLTKFDGTTVRISSRPANGTRTGGSIS